MAPSLTPIASEGLQERHREPVRMDTEQTRWTIIPSHPKTTDGLHAGAGTYSNGARLFGTHLPEDNLRILGHGQSSGQKGETDGVSYTNTLRIRTLQLMQMYSQYENHTLRNQRNHSLSPLVKVL
ncbi:hypothetical protein IAQ61_011318 [Plenodomus lingam]|uniref:uncharacterized protein n=1 Tax=Leptosphaeria maculans TaxID=5022 RepID=UPI003329C8F7|nr:hypothetical protein IAQ61_011318 [Plenodomus lingam]